MPGKVASCGSDLRMPCYERSCERYSASYSTGHCDMGDSRAQGSSIPWARRGNGVRRSGYMGMGTEWQLRYCCVGRAAPRATHGRYPHAAPPA